MRRYRLPSGFPCRRQNLVMRRHRGQATHRILPQRLSRPMRRPVGQFKARQLLLLSPPYLVQYCLVHQCQGATALSGRYRGEKALAAQTDS